MVLLQGAVVRAITKPVIECPYLNALSSLFSQEVEKEARDRVVAEIEILQVNAVFSLAHRLKEVVKFFLPRLEKNYAVIIREAHVKLILQERNNSRIASARLSKSDSTDD